MGRKVTINEFLDRAKAAHGDRYDYSQVRFLNTSTKVKIICPKHGPFMQLPYAHMRGGGCKQCSSEQRALTTEGFIERAREAFGDKYDYSLVKYENMYCEIDVVCPKHGVFSIEPMTFLRSHGCPNCFAERSR